MRWDRQAGILATRQGRSSARSSLLVVSPNFFYRSRPVKWSTEQKLVVTGIARSRSKRGNVFYRVLRQRRWERNF